MKRLCLALTVAKVWGLLTLAWVVGGGEMGDG